MDARLQPSHYHSEEHPTVTGKPPRLWHRWNEDLYFPPAAFNKPAPAEPEPEPLPPSTKPADPSWCVRNEHYRSSLVYKGLDECDVEGLPSTAKASKDVREAYPHLAAVNVPRGVSGTIQSGRVAPPRLRYAEAVAVLDEMGMSKEDEFPERTRAGQRIQWADEEESAAGTMEHFHLRAQRIRDARASGPSQLHVEGYDVFLEQLRRREREILLRQRELEMERIRGPTPGWHSMKGPQFATEVAKNNFILTHPDEARDNVEYRHKLMTAPL